MSHYKPYPAYKDSGVEWLGKVPEHWYIKSIKYLAPHIGSGKTPSGGSEVYQDTGILFLRSQNVYDDGLRLDDATYISEEIDLTMKGSRVRPNDVLLNITGASIGRSCLIPETFQPANVNQHVCIIRTESNAEAKWISLCLKSESVQAQIDFSQNGAGREGLNFEQIGNIFVSFPPSKERLLISQKVEQEAARLEGLIKKKTRFIELLREKRQALITHAVTKGLDSTAKMKDSGVESLGEVPNHWEITSVKRVITSIEQGWSPECESRKAEDEEWGVLKVGCVNGGVFRASENKALPSTLEPRPKLALQKGDILVSRANTRELVGGCTVIPTDFPRLMLCDKLYRLKVSNQIQSEFLAALISVLGRREVEVEATGASSSMVNIAQSVILNLKFGLPPKGEQSQIIAEVNARTTRLDTLLAKTELSLTLLKERRSALITAAVTGQIDLREAS
jgi:type I restriction enzyme S subunit